MAIEVLEDVTPDLTEAQRDRLLAELNAAIRREAPCLVGLPATSDLVILAVGIALRAVGRVGAVDAWVESEVAGPFQVRYRSAAGTSSLLTDGDKAALRALCSDAAVPGLPAGSFPDAPDYGRLFSTPQAEWRTP